LVLQSIALHRCIILQDNELRRRRRTARQIPRRHRMNRRTVMAGLAAFAVASAAPLAAQAQGS
jgi:hypothetical protein